MERVIPTGRPGDPEPTDCSPADAAFRRLVELASNDPAARAQFCALLNTFGLPVEERTRILFLFLTARLDVSERR
jgi:hypothetical protein